MAGKTRTPHERGSLMASNANPKTREFSRSIQRAQPLGIAPQRAVHYQVAEREGSVRMIQLPPDFAERVRQAKVLETPGLDEGLEESDRLIEDWKQSL